MSDHHAENDHQIDSLARAAEQQIVQRENERFGAIASTVSAAPSRSPWALGSIALFLGVLWIQWPSLQQPYTPLDPVTTSAVAEADLQLIGELLSAYKISQGKYPSSLDAVRNIPAGVSAPGVGISVTYQQVGDAYTLTWESPNWRVTLDGVSGNVTTVSRRG